MPAQIKRVVIKYGGSVLVPDEINTELLFSYKKQIKRLQNKNIKIYIIVGGGKTAKKYQEAIKLSTKDPKDLDKIGIIAANLNAAMVHMVLKDISEKKMVEKLSDPILLKKNTKSVIYKINEKDVGQSSNMDLLKIGRKIKADKIINISNIDYIYSDNPEENPNAQPIKEIAWKDYRKMIPKKWVPKMSVPIDPVASEYAQKNKLTVHCINGNNIKEVINAIEGKSFKGTTIHP